MSQANDHSHDGEQDVVESIVPLMPIVLPDAGVAKVTLQVLPLPAHTALL